MKKITKRSLSVLLAAVMLIGLLAGCNKDTKDAQETETTGDGTPSVQSDLNYPIEPEELGSGDAKWNESETADGWVMVTNGDGTTLGFSKDSGISLIQLDGYAFKDLNQNGKLDAYEDWRLDADAAQRTWRQNSPRKRLPD